MASLKNTIINDTGNLTLPVGSTAQRPSAAVGQTRFNSTLGVMEYYGSAGWTPLAQVRDGSTSDLAAQSMTDFDILRRPAGNYFFQLPSQDPLLSYTVVTFEYSGFDLSGTGFGWVKLFESPYNGTATTNLLGLGYRFNQFMIRRSDGAFWGTGGWADGSICRAFNYRDANSNGDLTNTGTKSGFRVFFGIGGGHGFYNTSQNPCNWSDSTGSIGAGWDGSSCGTFPNSLLWGTGTSSAVYDNRSGTWATWGRWL
jgi:hypothetical protein